MRNLITGGAGFIGSHLIRKLLNRGEYVICLDNFITSDDSNLIDFINNPLFELIVQDITKPLNIRVENIWHMACPASPNKYRLDPIDTIKTNFIGTYNMLELAKNTNAKLFFSSTSEIYGDPEIHPQDENYNGSVNTFAERSCYSEGKRISETLCFEFNRKYKIDIKVARIFNSYGPNMLINDGRVVSNFISQALRKESLTVYGNGLQTRSFCFINDVIGGILKLMESSYQKPVNIGHSEEITIKDLANIIKNKINKNINLIYSDFVLSEPKRRKPNIKLANKILNWYPQTSLNEGLDYTIDFFKNKSL